LLGIDTGIAVVPLDHFEARARLAAVALIDRLVHGIARAAVPRYEDLAARATARYVPLAFLASAAASAGRIDEAIALARRAWDEREPIFILWARHYHECRALLAGPRFQAILSEMPV
jgi:hypothetical protein